MQYRLYYMSPQTGHIERYEDFEALDDGQASRTAEAQLGKQPVELWSGHRKLRRYPYGSGFAGEGGRPAQASSVADITRSRNKGPAARAQVPPAFTSIGHKSASDVVAAGSTRPRR